MKDHDDDNAYRTYTVDNVNAPVVDQSFCFDSIIFHTAILSHKPTVVNTLMQRRVKLALNNDALPT